MKGSECRVKQNRNITGWQRWCLMPTLGARGHKMEWWLKTVCVCVCCLKVFKQKIIMCDHPPKQSEEKRKVYIHFFFANLLFFSLFLLTFSTITLYPVKKWHHQLFFYSWECIVLILLILKKRTNSSKTKICVTLSAAHICQAVFLDFQYRWKRLQWRVKLTSKVVHIVADSSLMIINVTLRVSDLSLFNAVQCGLASPCFILLYFPPLLAVSLKCTHVYVWCQKSVC